MGSFTQFESIVHHGSLHFGHLFGTIFGFVGIMRVEGAIQTNVQRAYRASKIITFSYAVNDRYVAYTTLELDSYASEASHFS